MRVADPGRRDDNRPENPGHRASMPAEHKIVATVANFATDVLEASDSRPVLIDFWAPWCGPCQTLLPILDRLADEYGGRFLLAKVNTDDEQQIAGHFGIRSLPTVMLVHRREIVEQFVGVQPERVYREALDRVATGPSAAIDPQPAAMAGPDRIDVDSLEAALQQRPRDTGLLVQLAELHLRDRNVDGAAAVIERLAEVDASHARLRSLRALVALTAIVLETPDPVAAREALASNPRDSAARHALAAHHALAGDFATAFAEWLDLMRTDRSFGDDAGRRAMVLAFDVLGDTHELVAAYRRKMANLLH
jgi:putative thioredoxin